MPDTEEFDTPDTPKELETTKHKGEKDDAATARVAGLRLAYSQPRHALIDAEAKVYETFAFGEEPEIEGGDGKRSAGEKKIGKGWNTATLPLHHVLRSVLVPTLLSREPTWVNRSRIGGGDEEKARGKIYEELAKVIWRENDMHMQATAALDDAMLKRCGWFLIDYDKKKRLPRIRWVDASKVRTDRENGQSPFTRDQRWWAEYRTISLKDAEYFAEHEWGAKGFKFTPRSALVDDDDDVQLESPIVDADGLRMVGSRERPTERVKLVFMYVKGANPDGGNANNSAKPGDVVEKGGEDAMYSGKDELLILECVGDEKDGKSYKFVGRKKWPFPCDPGECPAEPLRITVDNRDFFPASIFQPGHSLQEAANWAFRYYNTDVYNSSRRIVVYSEGHVDDKALNKGLYGTDNLITIKSKNRHVNDKWFSVQGFGEPSASLEKAIPANTQQYKDVVGLDKLDMEARSNRTATDAALLNQGGQLRTGFMADLLEYSLANVMRKAMQCARWNMNAEDVAHWVGEDMLGFYSVALTRKEKRSVEELDGTVVEYEEEVPTGETVRISDLWNDTVKDAASIRDEIGIDIEPRSVRFVNPEKEMEDIVLLFGKQLEAHKRLAEFQTPQEKVVAARASNAMLRMLAERMHLPNAHELLYDLEELVKAPPSAEQQQAQTAQMQAMMSDQGGPVTPQAEGAAGRVGASLGIPNPLGGVA